MGFGEGGILNPWTMDKLGFTGVRNSLFMWTIHQ